MSITHVHVGHPPAEWEGWEESHIIHFHKFKSLPSGKNEYVTSQDFRSCNNKWRVQLYPSGDNIAKAGYMSIFLEHRSPGDFSVQFHMSIKDSNGFKCGPMRTSSPSQFTADIKSLGYPDFVKLQNNFLTNGSLTVEVRMKPEECDTCRHFIPRNPFADQMFQLFMDEETSDISFNVQSPTLVDSNEDSAPAHSKEVFYAHKLVLKTCAKGSILDTLSDAEELPVPIIDVSPEVFRIMLFHVYGGEITADVWKTHVKDVLEASDKYGLTNLKIEAEAWYVKLQKFTPSDVVEAVAYADKMNCFLLKEAATNYIVANAVDVLSTGTLKDIPETNDIVQELVVSVFSINMKNDLNSHANLNLSMNDLRAHLASQGKDFDGSRDTLIARLE